MSGSDLPLRALAVFEAAARLRSFRAAADELNLTPSAVSHQIRFLESRLGLELFERAGRGVTLTSAGEDYQRDVREAFRRLRQATEALSRRAAPRPATEVLRIQTPPSLASQWLLPRLPAFLARHPGIDIRVNAEQGRNFQGLDLAIVYGPAEDWAERARPFLRDTLRPLCAPALAARVATPTDLLRQTLIRTRGNLLSWDDWLARRGLEARGARWLQFDPSHVAIDAAVKGLGVVLESDLLTEGDRAAGRLVAPLPAEAESVAAYWLLAPGPCRAATERLRDWLLAEAEG